jgi:hypothetical protein
MAGGPLAIHAPLPYAPRMAELVQAPGPEGATLDLARRALVERRYADAAAAADRVLAHMPDSFDARYVFALAGAHEERG